MKAITVYTMKFCPYCERAKSLLKSRNYSYTEIVVSVDDEAKWADLEQRSGMRTMPQIFVEDKCIGGFTELDALDRAGKLAEIVA